MRRLMILAVVAMLAAAVFTVLPNDTATAAPTEETTTVETPYGSVSMTSKCDVVTLSSVIDYPDEAGIEIVGDGFYFVNVDYDFPLGTYSFSSLWDITGDAFPIPDTDLSALDGTYSAPAECSDPLPDGYIEIDGVRYPATATHGPVVQYAVPEVTNPTSAHTSRHVWNGVNGAELLPCEFGTFWVDNSQRLVISHCLDDPNPPTTTTTEAPVTTTTEAPVTTTTEAPVTTTTEAPEVTSTTAGTTSTTDTTEPPTDTTEPPADGGLAETSPMSPQVMLVLLISGIVALCVAAIVGTVRRQN